MSLRRGGWGPLRKGAAVVAAVVALAASAGCGSKDNGGVIDLPSTTTTQAPG